MRYKAVRRKGKREGQVRRFATLKEALDLFYANYWWWRVVDTATGAEWEPY
jgi:hypothetical protein